MTSYNRIFITIFFLIQEDRLARACVSTFTIYTTHSLEVQYSGGKLLIPVCATLYGGNKNGLVNIQKQMLERRSEMTCSEREIN